MTTQDENENEIAAGGFEIARQALVVDLDAARQFLRRDALKNSSAAQGLNRPKICLQGYGANAL